jgi:lysine/ornithine N-monooxygenase
VERLDVAVVGAGPFGLSVAAHLAPRFAVRTFGEPMRTWRRRMPPEMLLRSDWRHTNLSAPDEAGSLDRWVEETEETRVEPIPLAAFLRYADWFRGRFVPESDPADIVAVDEDGSGFRVAAGGAELWARQLVVAVGVIPFPRVPRAFEGLDDPRVSYAVERTDFERLAGRRVAIVGGGNNAAETAVLALQAGAASVELLVRSEVRWFAEREPHTSRTALGRLLYRTAYPVVGFGPPPINRVALHPDLFGLLPGPVRGRLNARLLRPGAAPWIRSQVEGKAAIRAGCEVVSVDTGGERLRLRLTRGESLDVDVCVVAAGYRFDTRGLAFLSAELRDGLRTVEGWPVLDRAFRSSVPGIRLVGFAAEQRFGPMSRFVEGTRFAAARVAATA